MIDIVIYKAGPYGYLYEDERIPQIDKLEDARQIIVELYKVYVENPEWNVKEAYLNNSQTEGHIFGYCKDEHYMLTIEDCMKQTMMEVWNERLNTKSKMG